MNSSESVPRRIFALGGIFVAAALLFFCVLFNAQVTHGEENYEKAHATITKNETVEASRGIITDRNGKVLVSNRLVYTLSFDGSIFKTDEAENEAILRLLKLLDEHEVPWSDSLPLGLTSPVYTCTDATATALSRFSLYLSDRKFCEGELTEARPTPELSAPNLINMMRKDFGVAKNLSYRDARRILGVRYELALRRISNINAFVLAKDFDTRLIAEINDGRYLGAAVGTGSIRNYETNAAAHILGYIGPLDKDEYAELKSQGYAMDELLGKTGAESAFEQYLRGKNGRRVLTTNESGKITSEVYSVEPKPGNTVALTLDIDYQEQVEEILADTTELMKKADGLDRGSAAAVVSVGSGEVLALASYPTYSLASFNEDYAELSQLPVSPYYNRATSGTYPPGSTFKPITAVAALESGTITTRTTIRDEGIYRYYAPTYQPRCWVFSAYGYTHGYQNVSQAITNSCNYFFYEVGRLTGIETIDDYAEQFGLGKSTGIEIGDKSGVLASPEVAESKGEQWSGGQTIAAAIGQSYTTCTPIQLANYIATLVGDGKHYAAHLLKSVKSHDNSSVVALYDEAPLNVVEMSSATKNAVLSGMHELTVSGSVAYSFSQCVVSAGAKTGTAQTGTANNNGVFVCFAPYEDPQIALAIVIEKGGSGSALASAAVQMLNAWFSSADDKTGIVPENSLLA